MAFNSWYNEEQSESRHYLDYKDLVTLNIVCKTYHSAFGYYLDEVIFEEGHELLGLFPEITRDLNDDNEDEVFWYPDLEAVKKLAIAHNFSHKTIIVRLDHPDSDQIWEEKPSKVKKTWFSGKQTVKRPVYWYDFPFKKNKELRGNPTFEKPLKTRKYIKVNDPFEEIEIQSEIKGSPITMDDVLFATRGLCGDDTRSIEQYHVLSDDGSTLTLKADIDNWSS